MRGGYGRPALRTRPLSHRQSRRSSVHRRTEHL